MADRLSEVAQPYLDNILSCSMHSISQTFAARKLHFKLSARLFTVTFESLVKPKGAYLRQTGLDDAKIDAEACIAFATLRCFKVILHFIYTSRPRALNDLNPDQQISPSEDITRTRVIGCYQCPISCSRRCHRVRTQHLSSPPSNPTAIVVFEFRDHFSCITIYLMV